TSSIGFGSSANWLSRPTRRHQTIPASSKTRRCLVTACRVRLVPAVSREIDCALPFASLVSTDKRVSSPSAANTDARVLSATDPLCRLFDMLCDVFELRAPTALIHSKRLVAPVAWQLVEAGLDDAQQRPRCCSLQGKLDKRRRLSRIVLLGIDGVWMPGERK